MNETTVAIVGNAATDVRFQQTASGVPVASFRLASTARRFDRRSGCWVDGDTSFVTVWAFRALAQNVAGSVARGEPLVVTGRMRVREWEREGQRQTVVEVEARSVGHDMARGTSVFRRAVRSREPASEVALGVAPGVGVGGARSGSGPGAGAGTGAGGGAGEGYTADLST